ncbi:LptF/LptG family permease [Endomicrobium proavitum]|nr:LptF/LptG family permease [Endomicrobium proavitum]
MIKKIHAYIIKEFVYSFLFGLAVFSMLLLLDQVFQLVDLFLSKGVSLFLVIKLFALIFPNILTLAVPMAVLFGVLLAYGRFSEDNEITAMKANCVDYKTLSVPVIVFVAVLSFFLIFFNHFISPSMHGDFRNLFNEIITKRPLVKLDEKALISVEGYNIYANKVDNKNNSMFGITIYKFADQTKKQKSQGAASLQNDSGEWRMSASSGTVKTYSNGIQLTLYKGYWQRATPSNIKNMTHVVFQSYTFNIPFQAAQAAQTVTTKEMSSVQLLKMIKDHKKQDIPYTAYSSEYWQRWIFALAPIAFVLVAIPIGIMSGKGGKTIGFGMSLGVLLFYYMLFLLVLNLGEKGRAPLGLIIWLPNILTSGIGAYLFTRMVKK